MIVRINNKNEWSDTDWNMQFDLKYICEHAGKRVKDGIDKQTGRMIYYTPFPINQVRKIFKLIRRYGDVETIRNVTDYLEERKEEYKKIYEVWKKVSA